ncbi:hypothetical protein [Arundinibacter roseus]|uniref:Acetoacetate decarboxylase n=1 Tax=Arundinibacter roseus TaxID=2070510 RepID=A0A4R4KBQ9_9BACT|nr:hypothetical protein [Arundinibacter roseus]TDB65334.1 hypothetical protein EZE20_11600 [Arundinibacter roseus]
MKNYEDPFFTGPSRVAPAPWKLRGNGSIFLFRQSKEALQKYAFLKEYQSQRLITGLGALLLVDYAESPVGPYHELLYIPGIFKFASSYMFSISKIYVSSADSQWNGVENWGIPKEVADFDVLTNDLARSELEETWVVSRNKKPFFSVHLKRSGWKFPISTALFPLKIGQERRHELLVTAPEARGKGQRLRATGWFSDPEFFPMMNESNLLGGLAIRDFKMKFPIPNIQTVS